MENDRIDNRVYVGKCVGSCSVSRSGKKRSDTVNEWLKKKVWMLGKKNSA